DDDGAQAMRPAASPRTKPLKAAAGAFEVAAPKGRREPERSSATLAIRPHYQKFDVAVHRSTIDGFGAFAAEPVPPHRKIGEIRGESISVFEARRRAQGRARIMIVEVSSRKAVDASASTDPMRFTNHACEPNARLQVRDGRIEFYALRTIHRGE